jgi:pilus assembly protein CpaF
MNTGHEGSITTVHANNADDALRRVEAMVIMAGMDLPSTIIREYIVGALDIIVQATRLTDGTRKIVSISEVQKMDGKHRIVEIFKFQRTGLTKDGEVEGHFTPTGEIPQCLNRIRVFGIDMDESLFQPVKRGVVV